MQPCIMEITLPTSAPAADMHIYLQLLSQGLLININNGPRIYKIQKYFLVQIDRPHHLNLPMDWYLPI